MNTATSRLSQNKQQVKSFRVLIKSRLSHDTIDPQAHITNRKANSSLQMSNLQQAKKKMKKYISTMKASSSASFYKEQNTKRSHIQKQNNILSNRLSTPNKDLINRTTSNNYLNDGFEAIQNLKIKQQNQADKDMNIKIHLNQLRNRTKTEQLRNEQGKSQYHNENLNYQNKQDDKEVSVDMEKTNYLSFLNHNDQRSRLDNLQTKLESLLNQKLKCISLQSSFTLKKQTNQVKLIQIEIQRILYAIKQIKIKSNRTVTFNDSIQNQEHNTNENLQLIQKKVKMIQRLIAQNIFQADNLKNQFLLNFKQRHAQSLLKQNNLRTIYRQGNSLNPANFKQKKQKKPNLHPKSTNQVQYKVPCLKSFYITPKKDNLYNSSRISQPLPRSSYKRQYFQYGYLPECNKSTNIRAGDHSLFNYIETQQQKNHLKKSSYHDDYVTKVEQYPLNFKELACYKDKFKSLQVNFGKDKNIDKIVNNKTAQHLLETPSNRYKTNPQIDNFITKQKGFLKVTTATELNRSISNLLKTQQQTAQFQQANINKNNLFEHRIKSQIKNKNINALKYQFNKQLINNRKEMVKNY